MRFSKKATLNGTVFPVTGPTAINGSSHVDSHEEAAADVEDDAAATEGTRMAALSPVLAI
jgi:hypothetical protein